MSETNELAWRNEQPSGAGILALLAELKSLRKGRGLHATDINRRVGGAVRQICGVTDLDGPADVRRKVSRCLESLAAALPPDLRLAALAAFGAGSSTQQPLYQDRVAWAAAQINRDPRTARRRIDEAIVQLAQLATARVPQAASFAVSSISPITRWHTTDLTLSVLLGVNRMEAVEHRKIVVDRDEVDKLRHPTINSGGTGDTRLLFGGSRLEQVDGAQTLHLSRVLSQGENHRYSVLHHVANCEHDDLLTWVPQQACDRFELRVRFDGHAGERRFRPLHGVLPHETPADGVEEETVDPAGEIALVFHDLHPGYRYGLRGSTHAALTRP